jgi:hypothetical protein
LAVVKLPMIKAQIFESSLNNFGFRMALRNWNSYTKFLFLWLVILLVTMKSLLLPTASQTYFNVHFQSMISNSHIVSCFIHRKVILCHPIYRSIEFAIWSLCMSSTSQNKIIFVLYSCWYGGSPLTSYWQVDLLLTMTHFSKILN